MMPPHPQPQPDSRPPGEVEVFERLVSKHASRLYRLAARLLGSTSEADDVVQEGFFRAFEQFRDRRFERPADPLPWLITVVTRVALNVLREGQRRSARDDAWHHEQPRTVHSAEALAALSELSKWLDALPEDQRVALVLKEIEGLSTSQVGEAMGCSVGAVEQRVFRARTALKERAGS